MQAINISDWVPDREYETANGQSYAVTSGAHRFDMSFVLSDVSGEYRLAAALKAHWLRNRGSPFTIPMPQELYRGAGFDSHGAQLADTVPSDPLPVSQLDASNRSRIRVTVNNTSIEFVDAPLGWYFAIQGQSKVYRLQSMLSLSLTRVNARTQDVDIEPELRQALPQNARLLLKPMYRCYYDPKQPPDVVNDNRDGARATVNLIEAV